MIVIDKEPKTNNVVVTLLKVFDDRNDIIARIDQDGFWVQNALRRKRPDPSTLIVYDHSDTEVLRLRLLNSNTIYIQGTFRHAKLGEKYLLITETAAIAMPAHNSFLRNCLGGANVAIAYGTDGSIGMGGIGGARTR